MRLEDVKQARVCVRQGDDALDADAVLACGLEGAAHNDCGCVVELTVGEVVEEDGGVFAAQLGADRGEGYGGGGEHGAGDGLGANEGYVGYGWVRG